MDEPATIECRICHGGGVVWIIPPMQCNSCYIIGLYCAQCDRTGRELAPKSVATES